MNPNMNEALNVGLPYRPAQPTHYRRGDGQPGDINFAVDSFYRQFTTHPDTSAVANLPDMQACPEQSRRGSGAVRDLSEAANNCRWRIEA